VRFSWKRWRLAPLAALTALAMSLALAGPAFAAEPGEWGSWGVESANGQQIYVHGTVSEARNNGNLVDVWRGETNNHVWISINNGNPITLQNPDGSYTETYYSPVVVPWESARFMIFHTGTDGNIYYTWIDPTAGNWAGSWTAIPGQSTNMAVSAAQIGNQGEDIYLVYHSSSDDRIWGTYFDGQTWGSTQNIGGGNSPAAPSVTYNNYHLYAFARGEDNQVWMAQSYDIFGQTWTGWSPQGGYTYISPEVTTNLNTGEMVVNYVDENSYRPSWRIYDSNGNPTGWWSQDTTGYQTVQAVALSWVAGAIFAILTGLNDAVWYKQVTG
jgi:hypothetical protein